MPTTRTCSTAPALLPNGLAFEVGKSTAAYVLNQSHLGGVGGQIAVNNSFCFADGGSADLNGTLFVPCSGGVEAVTVTSSPSTAKWTTAERCPRLAHRRRRSRVVHRWRQPRCSQRSHRRGRPAVRHRLLGVVVPLAPRRSRRARPCPVVTAGRQSRRDPRIRGTAPASPARRAPPPPPPRYWLVAIRRWRLLASATPASSDPPALSPSTGRSWAWRRTPDSGGYWLVAVDGGVFSFGDAHFHGSTGAIALNKPIVGMAATPDGQRLLAGGSRRRASSPSATPTSTGRPAPRPQPTRRGHGRHPGRAAATGWWPPTAGSSPSATPTSTGRPARSRLNQPIVGMAATPDGHGYWLVAADGGHLRLRRRPLLRVDRLDPRSTSRWWAWPLPRTGTATGWWHPTAASSPSVTPSFEGSIAGLDPGPSGGGHGRRPTTSLLTGRQSARAPAGLDIDLRTVGSVLDPRCLDRARNRMRRR